MRIDVREERTFDVEAIRDVNKRAFGQEQEANIVDALRSNGAASLSLVATVDSTVAGHVVAHVVGHIMYSPVEIGPLEGIGLGPVAVLPEYQRRGIGSVLVETGNRRLELSRCPFIVVLGHPAFYPRFGFKPASTLGVSCEWDVPDDVFQILVLDPLRLAGVSGVARYRREFSPAI
jgi:putative acetyltransferase